MAAVTVFVPQIANAVRNILRHYAALAMIALELTFQTIPTALVALSGRGWDVAQETLSFNNYRTVTAASYQKACTTSKIVWETYSTRVEALSTQLPVAALTLAQRVATDLVENMIWATDKLWYLQALLRPHVHSSQTRIAETFWRLESLVTLYTETAIDTGNWLVGELQDNVILLNYRFTVALLSYWRAIDPRYLFWLGFICIITVLLRFRRHRPKLYQAFSRIIGGILHVLSPLSQLERMQLEMVVRKTMPCSYVYDYDKLGPPRRFQFGSTVQLHRPRMPLKLRNLPPAILSHIFSLALTSTSQFSWSPRENELLLGQSSEEFRNIWFVARSLGYILPGNTITIDACTVPPARLAWRPDDFFFVSPRTSGHIQLFGMLAWLEQPSDEPGQWSKSVAASMRAGERWMVVVRSSWDRVYNYDIALIIRALQRDHVRIGFPGVRVEYRIVVGDEGNMERKGRKILDLVRGLKEAVQFGNKDARFKVTVEGLEAWEELVGTRELAGRLVVEAVKEVVKEMNRFSVQFPFYGRS